MSFSNFIMVKVFIAALGSSAISFASVGWLMPDRLEKIRAARQTKSLAAVTAGALTLGAGLAISGACPGTIFAQLGAGAPSAGLTMAGALAGALGFSLLRPHLNSLYKKWSLSAPFTIDGRLKASAPTMMAVLGILGIGASYAFEELMPEASASSSCSLKEPLRCAMWHPTFAGAILGSLQLPSAVILSGALGTSTSFQILVSHCLKAVTSIIPGGGKVYKGLRLNETCDNFCSFELSKIGQLIFTLGVTAGSWLAQSSSDGGPIPASSISDLEAFGGGFLIVIGARLAGGCTSGHGLSGCALLMLTSW
ncbi:unnamed protein product [Chrysoparadoxa australica]